jgi:hypothetical protein
VNETTRAPLQLLDALASIELLGHGPGWLLAAIRFVIREGLRHALAGILIGVAVAFARECAAHASAVRGFARVILPSTLTLLAVGSRRVHCRHGGPARVDPNVTLHAE